MKVLELFAGIGACSKALKNLGIKVDHADVVEIDKYAIKSFNAVHGTSYEPQDITQWNKKIDDVDLIMHGSPCQDFSLAGKQAGADEGSGTRSSLMYETIRIVKNLKPKYVVWENVKNVLSKKHVHNFNNYIQTMCDLDYNNYYQVLNAKDYGIPQNRERIFVVSIRADVDNGNFEFPEKEELKLKLKDLLETDVDEKFFLSDQQLEKILLSKNENLLSIKNATKKGFQNAYHGDSINLSYPESKTRRGRVGKQVSQTIQCNDSMAVAIGDSIDLQFQKKRWNRIKKGITGTICTKVTQGVFTD